MSCWERECMNYWEAAPCDQLELGLCRDYGITLVVLLILVTTGRI
jgi:hypothetical protein